VHSVAQPHCLARPVAPSELAAVPVNWWEQVENEYWAVDEHGVVGREELWKRRIRKRMLRILDVSGFALNMAAESLRIQLEINWAMHRQLPHRPEWYM